ncbi:MAG: GxxExxY protein [Chitinophagaceae bacterium]|nr:GxxExxY protein [Chitinophagaceae bacterium]
MELLHTDTTDKIIKAFYKVNNELGFGFLEKVYQNALLLELVELGLHCEKQKQVKVYYRGQVVGEYFADLIANDSVIIELKAAEILVEAHELQLINYLKATEMEVGLLLNFGRKPQFKRKIFTNNRKNNGTQITQI